MLSHLLLRSVFARLSVEAVRARLNKRSLEILTHFGCLVNSD